MGIDSMIFELDCKRVVDAVHSSQGDISEFGSIIDDCRVLLSSNPNFKVKFVWRQVNMVVHILVRVAINLYCKQSF